MTQNVNAAYRAHDLLSKAAALSQGKTGDVWAEALQVPSERLRESEKWSAVAERLTLLQAELEQVRSQMEQEGYERGLYEKYLNKAEHALGLGNLSTGWSTFRSDLDEATLQTLRMCATLLPDEERLLPEEDLKRIRALVQELRQALEAESVPEELRRFLSHQLDIVERALGAYPISGARAFERAFAEVAVAMQEHGDFGAEFADREEVGLFRRLLSALDKAVLATERYERLGKGGVRLVNWLVKKGPSLLQAAGEAADKV